MTLIDRAYGALVGSAVGDAMGMPASFLTRSQIKKTYGHIEDFLEPDKDVQEKHGDLDAGDVTDDTRESEIISNILIRDGRFTEEAFNEEMKKWAVENKMLETTVIGPSTRAYLEAVIAGNDTHPTAARAETNGSAMRVAPVGIKYNYDVTTAIEAAADSSRPSHASKPTMAGACAVAAAVAAAVNGKSTPSQIMKLAFDAAVFGERQGAAICAPSLSRRIKLAVELVDKARGMKTTYIVNELADVFGASMKVWESVPLALGIFYAVDGNAKEGIIAAINAGDDADTNASICGALCGAYSGVNSMPYEWAARVRKSSGIDFKEKARQLLRRS